MKKHSIKWLNWAFFFENQQYLLPVMLFFYLENGLEIGDYILFQSVSYIMYVLLGVPVGYVSDHFSKKYILITGCFLNLCRLSLWLCFGGYWIVLAGEMVMVVVRLLTTGMTDSYVYEYLRERSHTSKTLMCCGRVVSVMSYGMAIAALLSPVFYNYCGVYFLLCLELMLTFLGIVLLCFLPKTKVYNRQNYSVREIKNAFWGLYRVDYLCKLISYNVFMYISTTLFVSNFQPLMKLSAVPVILFGFIYFLNQLMRGLFAHLVKKIATKISLIGLLTCTSVMIVTAFGLFMTAFIMENEYVTLVTLVFACIVIGLQLANQVITISEIHKYTQSCIRATSISVFNMLCRGIGGLMLALFKNISSNSSFSNSFLIFGILFLVNSVWMLCRIHKSRQNLPEIVSQ